MTTKNDHWQSVYQNKGEQQTSWFRQHLDESLRLIDTLNLSKHVSIIDVGGGRATLVDDLQTRGFTNVSVLDLSEAALTEARQRLGVQGERVHWLAADITTSELPTEHYGLWHDRAVFHFLTEPLDRNRYIDTVTRSVHVDGFAIIATFALDGPEKCSGLPVCRYDANSLAALFSPAFECVADSCENHVTPFGIEQPFTYVLLQRQLDSAHTLHETSKDVRSAHATE